MHFGFCSVWLRCDRASAGRLLSCFWNFDVNGLLKTYRKWFLLVFVYVSPRCRHSLESVCFGLYAPAITL